MTVKLLKLLQYCCENSHANFQNYIRAQAILNEKKLSINMV
jgi:hypothetical protein